MSADQKYRITYDVLIARTAKRLGVTVVTDNIKDFEAIQRFCHVRLISGDDYFKRQIADDQFKIKNSKLKTQNSYPIVTCGAI
jgi:hypothetical protein